METAILVFDNRDLLGVDDSNIKYAPGQFRLERRQAVPFSDNAYYSLARPTVNDTERYRPVHRAPTAPGKAQRLIAVIAL